MRHRWAPVEWAETKKVSLRPTLRPVCGTPPPNPESGVCGGRVVRACLRSTVHHASRDRIGQPASAQTEFRISKEERKKEPKQHQRSSTEVDSINRYRHLHAAPRPRLHAPSRGKSRISPEVDSAGSRVHCNCPGHHHGWPEAIFPFFPGQGP